MAAIMAKLLEIQSELKVEKGSYNRFGKFNYRSKEDILEAAKPLCHERGLVLLVNDSVQTVATDWVYVVASAQIVDAESGEIVAATGYAREPKEKKGADSSQITGMAASYAGKRALGNLFAIDDTKDADAPQQAPQGQTARCSSCGKSYPVRDKQAYMDWVAAGAEACCAAPAWKLV